MFLKNDELIVNKYAKLSETRDRISLLKKERHKLSLEIVKLEDEEERVWKEILKEMRK